MSNLYPFELIFKESLARSSASIESIPKSLNIDEAADFPDPIPPVNPIILLALY